MYNFSNVPDGGYNRQEVNAFVDYVIKKTEENVLTIKKQKDEIEFLKSENERLSRLEQSYAYIQNQVENSANEIKANAKYEAELIIREAKDNASAIVNDALLKSQKLIDDRERLNQTLKAYKRKVRNALMEQLEIMEDIEVL
jgi:cell division initiation protein